MMRIKRIIALACLMMALVAGLCCAGIVSAHSAPSAISPPLKPSPIFTKTMPPKYTSTPRPTATPTPTPIPTMQPVGKTCLFIGDSLTERGMITKALLGLQDNATKITLFGTRGIAPNLHEGRTGWKASSYMASRYSGVNNAFYNPAAKAFDFPYYMSACDYSNVQYVFIELGINDTFNYKTDVSLNAEIPRILNRYDRMISSIQDYDLGIKIGICVTIPPTSIASTFRADYGTSQTLDRYSRNNSLWVKALMDKYRNRESSGIYLIPTHTGISRTNIYGVHPTAAGYKQMAAVIWQWLKTH